MHFSFICLSVFSVNSIATKPQEMIDATAHTISLTHVVQSLCMYLIPHSSGIYVNASLMLAILHCKILILLWASTTNLK